MSKPKSKNNDRMKEPIKINLNGYATIFPTEKGWIKIKELLLFTLPKVLDGGVTAYMEQRTAVVDGNKGYRDQLWQIMHDFGTEFWSGSDFAGSEILFEPLEV